MSKPAAGPLPPRVEAASPAGWYQDLFERMPTGLLVLRLENRDDPGSFRLIAYNPASERLVGIPLSRFLNQTIRESNPEELATGRPDRYATVLRAGRPQALGDMRSSHPDVPPESLFSVWAIPLSDDCLALMFEDVTERRRTQNQLEASQQEMARAQQLARMGSWNWEVESNRLTWSDELYRIYGVAPGTPLRFEIFVERLHPDDRDRVRSIVQGALERPAPFRFEERIIRPDGTMRVLDSQGDVLQDQAGKPRVLFGFCRDVTEERAAQQALVEREQRFSKLFHASPVGMSLSTLAEGILLDVNQRWCELTGYSREEVVSRTVRELDLWAQPEDRDRVVGQLRAHGSVREAEVLYRTRSGLLRRTLAILERIEVDRRDCMLILLLRT